MQYSLRRQLARIAYPAFVGGTLLAAAWSHSVQGGHEPRQSPPKIRTLVPHFSYEATTP